MLQAADRGKLPVRSFHPAEIMGGCDATTAGHHHTYSSLTQVPPTYLQLKSLPKTHQDEIVTRLSLV